MTDKITEYKVEKIATAEEAENWMQNYKDGDPVPAEIINRKNALMKKHLADMDELVQRVKDAIGEV